MRSPITVTNNCHGDGKLSCLMKLLSQKRDTDREWFRLFFFKDFYTGIIYLSDCFHGFQFSTGGREYIGACKTACDVRVGIFWKRANAQGAFYSLVIGVGLGAIFFYLNEIAGITSVHFLYIAPILFIACTAILVIGSLMTAPPDESKVKQYIWTKEFYDA